MQPARLQSLDDFRGATIVSMLLVNNPGDGRHVFEQLDHAAWNGWTFTDLIFPFFLWIVGVSMTMSKRTSTFGQIARRAALIFLMGFAINFTSRWSFSSVRIMGVLHRIGLCYFFARPIYLALPHVRALILAPAPLL